MYLTIREYKTNPQSVHEILVQDEKNFVPTITKAEGFREYACIDNGHGVLTSVSVFENRTQGEKFNTVALEWVRNNLSSQLPTSPKVTSGEILNHATGKILAS